MAVRTAVYDEDECRHGLDPFTCSICLSRQRPPERDRAYYFEAKFETVCPGCRMPIYPGQAAVKRGDRPALHARCD